MSPTNNAQVRAASTESPETRAELTAVLDDRDPFVSWQIVDVQFPDEPNTDFVIPHDLQPHHHPRDVHYRVIKQFTNGDVYESAAADAKQWTNRFIVLRSDVPKWTGRILLGILKQVTRFATNELDIPDEPPADCCEDLPPEPPPDGEECPIYCTTVGMQTLPAAGNGTSMTPSGVAWTNSAWAQVVPAMAEDSILCSINIFPGVHEHGNFFEIDVGVGDYGAEVAIATLQGYIGGGSGLFAADTGNSIILPMPMSGLTGGERICVRMRQTSTDTSEWRGSLQYYTKTDADAEGMKYVATGPEVWPSASARTAITPSGTDWGNSTWSEITGSTGSEWIIGGITTYGYPTNVSWEMDIGIGDSGSEVVLTTIRGQNERFFVGDAWEGGFNNILIRPLITGIASGSRVAVRLRKAGTYTASNWSVGLTFYRETHQALVTAKPQSVVPAAGDSIYVEAPGSSAMGDWVEFIPSTSADIAITAIIPSAGNVGTTIVEIGVGGAGSEETVGSFAFASGVFGYGGVYHMALPVAISVPAGSRVSLRNSIQVALVSGRDYAITYIESPDFVNQSDELHQVFDPVLLVNPAVAWDSSAWVEISSGLTSDMRLTAYSWDINESETELDLGVGIIGNEQVITTIRLSAGNNSSSVGLMYQVFPVPVCTEAGSRLAVRVRSTTTGFTHFTLMSQVNSGAVSVSCGPDPIDEGSGGDSSCDCEQQMVSADPASPTEGEWWIRDTGTSPTNEIELRVRKGGVSYTLAGITL